MDLSDLTALFTQPDGTYLFARWQRPIVPVVFGIDDATLAIVKGAIEAVVAAAGHRMAETDPEQGANLFVFFVKDWAELGGLPDLEGLVPGITGQVERLDRQGGEQYRQFRFEADGAIRACFAFLCMGGVLGDAPAEDLALALAARIMLLWSDQALSRLSLVTSGPAGAALAPEFAALLRAAYDPVLPAAARDPAHALRLLARLR